ncbi:MAG: hypothetical protein JWM93_382 [Frankiales bacterium]|nr:hypothetical protein [Frankiales bacterium]
MHAGTAAVVAVALLIVVTPRGRTAAAADAPVDAAAANATVDTVTHLGASILDRAAAGNAVRPPRRAPGADVTIDGKPSVLYVGAEFCPYCAAERWPLIVALSRFGTFAGLGVSHSSLVDVYPGTATLTFHGSSYTSPYLHFTGKELYTNEPVGRGYAPLDTLTPEEQRRFGDRAANPQQAFPFLDIGGHYLVDTQYDTGALAGLTAAEIARATTDPLSHVGGLIDASANWLTAALCERTGNQPADVCTSPVISALEARLP